MADIKKEVIVSAQLDAALGAAVDVILAAYNGQFDAGQALTALVSQLSNLAAIPAELKDNKADAIEAIGLQSTRLIVGVLKLQGD